MAPLVGRLRALARRWRLSPLAAMLLAALAALDIVALVFATFAILGADEGAEPPKAQWRPPSLQPEATKRVARSGDDAQTLSRPIFSKTRRPRSQAKIAEPSEGLPRVASPAGLTLTAIVKAGKPRVFIVSGARPEGDWLSLGETVQGWTIVEVGSSDLTLTNGAQSARLSLYPENGSAPPERVQPGFVPRLRGGAR